MAFSKLVFTPLSYTGWGSLEQLIPEVEKYGAKRILLVTDPVLKQIGLTDRITGPLKQKGFDVDIYTDIEPEPPLEVGEKLVKYTREGGFDLVIGLGGGSALDLAKLAAVLSEHEGLVADYLNLSGTKQVSKKGLSKILIPTTSGTGSEVTNIAVLSLETTKDVVTHDYLLADSAIVDPELTVTMPANVTAATGVDALTHAIEAYVSVNGNPTTDGLALQAIRLISRSIRKAVADGQNKQARIDMSDGSYIAGLAFFNAGVAGVHALAYPLGGQFHIPHGESNAVLLPYVMGYIRSSCTKRMADILNALGGNSAYLSDEEASYKCVEELEKLVADVGIPQILQGFGIPESALEKLTEDGVKQKRLLARSPLPLDKEDIFKIYQSAYVGKVTEPSSNKILQ
ncbi:alcohol dehydrogenase [Bacillus canaveralius]|uniref:Alcohol dehydrogenase n=1 Tax=Bacillus canaveralius TaxID=1403243 RepID=A0A2N5GMV9_9BACI|nr:iron-containing alcohol dehydrogenase [Bacillus canaveralius]PLR83280.1 alcohol dehydrogenase [Bacillus canaveralius]PLR96673.1 alcohol dehydrogenase [Bacillus canaveralius]